MEQVIEFPDGTASFNGYLYSRKRTAYLKAAQAIGTHAKEQWIRLCAKYDFKCCRCNSEVIGGIPTKDHIIPITSGGSDLIDNLQPLCRECNTSKGCETKSYRYNG